MVAKAKTANKTTKASASKSATPKKAASVKKSRSTVSDEEIARQAYMLWLERGGSEMENWLEAERQLR